MILEGSMPVVDPVTGWVRSRPYVAVNGHLVSTKLAEPVKPTADTIPGP